MKGASEIVTIKLSVAGEQEPWTVEVRMRVTDPLPVSAADG